MNSFKKYFLFIIFLVSFSGTGFNVTFDDDQELEECMKSFNQLTLEEGYQDEVCGICWQTLDPNKDVMLPCLKNNGNKGLNHGVHKECIDAWVNEKINHASLSLFIECPFCLSQIPEEQIFNDKEQLELFQKRIFMIIVIIREKQNRLTDMFLRVLLPGQDSKYENILGNINANFKNLKREIIEESNQRWLSEELSDRQIQELVKLTERLMKHSETVFGCFKDTCIRLDPKRLIIMLPALFCKITGNWLSSLLIDQLTNYTINNRSVLEPYCIALNVSKPSELSFYNGVGHIVFYVSCFQFFLRVVANPELRHKAYIPLLLLAMYYSFFAELL